MKLHSYYPPELEEGDDYPTLRINVDTEEKQIGCDPIHLSAIIICSQPLIDIALSVLKFLGIKEYRS